MWNSTDNANKAEHYVTSPIIETLGVSRVYKVGAEMFASVSDVTMRVGYGEFAVIFGRSGAGKSTLMNMLIGLDKPDTGEVFLKGEALFAYSEEQRTTIRRKKISYLPQTTQWIDGMNVVDNVALPLYLLGNNRRVARKKAAQLLGEVGLHDKSNMYPKELSSGQQQLASVARALAKQPWMIFADEPTAHLDTKSAEEVTRLLMQASQDYGISIVMVTHDLNFLKLADRWFFMKDGRLWDIQDRNHLFSDIKEAMDFVERSQMATVLS